MSKSVDEKFPFFAGNVSREEARSMLFPLCKGLFLIRNNHHFKGDYALSVVFSKSPPNTPEEFAVEHYRIKVTGDACKKLTIDDEEFFDNFGDLVKHYRADADGLVTHLTFHVKQIPEKHILDRQKLNTGELIGKGNFSEVFEGVYNGEPVAIKILKDQNAAYDYLLEANVMVTLDHPNLVRFVGLIQEHSLTIVTELLSKGSLLDYLRSRGRSAITPKELVKFARDTCAGMAYLESKHVVHRDLAARNILIQEDGTAKVADFGLARTVDEADERQSEGKIAVRWTAPEAYLRKEFSSKSDVWSFGVVLWEIYSFGRVPYPRILIADVMKNIESGYLMDPPEGCPPAMHKVMDRVWKLSPQERPSFKELLNELKQMD